MSKKTVVLLIALVMMLAGCSEQPEKDPWVMDVVTSMGGLQDAPTVQYRIDIAYTGSNDVRIVDIIPHISKNPAVFKESQQTVEQKKTSRSIEGKLIIYTEVSTKEQLIGMEPFITGVTILWQENDQIYETIKRLG